MIGPMCLIHRPYSAWHGESATIEYVLGYGVIAPDWITSNGCASMIRKCIDDPKDKVLFDEFVELIVAN